MDKMIIYVSVGHPALPMPFQNRVRIDTGKDARSTAKEFRMQVAGELHLYGFDPRVKIRPADLYWAVFSTPDEEKPIICSDNYHWKYGLRKEFGDPEPDSSISGFVTYGVASGLEIEAAQS